MFNLQAMRQSRRPSPLALVDIGAAGGLQRKWAKYRRRISPVMFEPNPAEAARLRRSRPTYPSALVMEHGLGESNRTYTLNLAHWPGCTSLLTPDPTVLAGYKIAPLFETVKQVKLECVRFDELYRAGRVPAPDVIKVDVEGYEYEVLCGFGELLHGVLGIEAEAWFYPVFKGQKLLHDLVALLSPFDLYLRRIEPVPGFEGDLVCVNAYFTRGKGGQPDLTQEQRQKFALLQRVWCLNDV
ncbi:MAG: methyltransferase FkbM family [Rhodospirillales bacterium]|nr:methyltransferase FkbM family [Rhodospirillales bacterium]